MIAFLWVLLALGVLALLCLGVSYPVTRRQKQKIVSDPGQQGLSFEEVSFTTQDSILLRGWWIPAGESRRTIIFLHGYAGSCDPDLKYAPLFYKRGFNVLMFDFRAHGRSAGNLSSIGALERKDCLAAIQFAREKGSQSIGLFGFSMGGRVAILAAPDAPEIKAVISDGGPARMSTAFAAELKIKGLPGFLALPIAYLIWTGASIRAGLNLFALEPLYQAKRLADLPILFIHGDRDPYTRSDEFLEMVQSVGEKSECWHIPEAGHRNADFYRPDEYPERIISFFEKYLPLE